MAIQDRHQALVGKLREIDRQIDWERFFETLEAGASRLTLQDPYAFLMACCLDRQTPSKVIWTIPHWLGQRWGHLDPSRVRRMSRDKLSAAVAALPRRPRFANEAPGTIRELTRIVVDEHGGDSRALWRGRTAAEFHWTLRRIPGVGPGIASMAVQLVNRVFPGELIAGGEAALDIKADTHTRRVLFRLGLAEDESDAAAIAAARTLYPEQPGRLDGALWYVGKVWCHKGVPDCEVCELHDVCCTRASELGWCGGRHRSDV